MATARLVFGIRALDKTELRFTRDGIEKSLKKHRTGKPPGIADYVKSEGHAYRT